MFLRHCRALRGEGGLDFVVAPVPTVDGTSVVRLGPRHIVAVFPFLCPEARRFERDQEPDERAALVRLLVALHQATPTVRATALHHRVEIPGRRNLSAALEQLAATWVGGPFSAPARDLLGPHAETVR